MFGFPTVEHKTFKNNFLKTVIFQLTYDENQFFDEKKEEIISIFKEKYPISRQNVEKGFQISLKKDETPILQPIKDKEGIEFKSKDGQKVVSINKSVFSFTVDGSVYKDYKELKTEIDGINKFFALCNIDNFKRIAIRKINIFEFKDAENPNSVLEFVLKPELTNNTNYYPKSELIKHNMHSINYDEGSWRLNLKYGLFMNPMIKKKDGQVIVDIDLFNTEKIPLEKLYDVADKINCEIYNIFNWAISEQAIRLLNE